MREVKGALLYFLNTWSFAAEIGRVQLLTIGYLIIEPPLLGAALGRGQWLDNVWRNTAYGPNKVSSMSLRGQEPRLHMDADTLYLIGGYTLLSIRCMF